MSVLNSGHEVVFLNVNLKNPPHLQYLQGNIYKMEFWQKFKIKIRKHMYTVHKDTHFRSKDS